MDIMEMVNGNGDYETTYHWQTTFPRTNCSYPKGHEHQYAHKALPDWNTAFHEYAVERGLHHVAFVLDGQVMINITRGGSSPEPMFWDVPFYLILNSAIGGGWPGEPNATTVFPVEHAIDYVRVTRQQLKTTDEVTVAFCTDRERGCSGHGECRHQQRLCVCDAMYEGERCDTWRSALPIGVGGKQANVTWHNCTHSVNSVDGSLVQHCSEQDKSPCLQAGAPTVPPPHWDGLCYQAPTAVNPAISDDPICKFPSDWEHVRNGEATVIHGVNGSICAQPCRTQADASCTGCPDNDCTVKNKSTGQCAWCAGCKETPETSQPCQPAGKVVCPCGVPKDSAGRPILAQPQCVLNRCSGPLQREPMCALTCDPDMLVPPGRSLCQPGATCQRAPNAAFTPGGLCTFPDSPLIPAHVPGVPPGPSPPPPYPGKGWSWADYHQNQCAAGSTGCVNTNRCGSVKFPRFTCVQNGSFPGANDTFCVDVSNSTPYFPFPVIWGDDATCQGHCKAPPPGLPVLLPPHCHPPTPPPSPPSPPPAVRYACDRVNHNCFATPGGKTSNRSACDSACKKPLPPPSPPPPPLATSPCIRFLHALPVDRHVDVTITQNSNVSHTWSNYGFADFSNWVNVFVVGTGSITIWENVNGQRGVPSSGE